MCVSAEAIQANGARSVSRHWDLRDRERPGGAQTRSRNGCAAGSKERAVQARANAIRAGEYDEQI